MNYFVRRIAYMIPILLGVNLLTFLLFFKINTPDDMARIHLGEKYISTEAIEAWKKQHGYALPMFYNANMSGIDTMTQTLFFQKSLKLFVFDFGRSDNGRDISHDIHERMWPSLWIALPSLIIGLMINVLVAMIMVFFHEHVIDRWGLVICTAMMSISGLFYIIIGQYVLGKIMQLFPVSGFSGGWFGLKFLIMPVLISVIAGLGSGVRWYRSIFLEELSKDYVRTAQAKGLSPLRIMMVHVLKNAMIPILTGVVVLLPSLFMGSLILESFFAIPGLGSYTIDAIGQQDFAIVRVMVFLGAFLYIIGLILTDLSYMLVDPRVRLGDAQ